MTNLEENKERVDEIKFDERFNSYYNPINNFVYFSKDNTRRIVGIIKGNKVCELTTEEKGKDKTLDYTPLNKEEYLANMVDDKDVEHYIIPLLRFVLLNNLNPITVIGYNPVGTKMILPLTQKMLKKCEELGFLSTHNQPEEEENEEKNDDYEEDSDEDDYCQLVQLDMIYRATAYGAGLEIPDHDGCIHDTYKFLIEHGVVPPIDVRTYQNLMSGGINDITQTSTCCTLTENIKHILLSRKLEREKVEKELKK